MAVSVVAALAVAIATAPSAQAALAWTLTANPTTVAAGTTTTFSMTATNLVSLTPIRCIDVEVDRIFDVVSASASGDWTATIAGGSGNRVRLSSSSGIGGLLRPLSMTFAIEAKALTPGQAPWTADAYSRSDCAGSGGLIGTEPTIRVIAGPTPVPTPAPTPTVPPPSPTPKPTLPPPPPTPVLPSPTPNLTIPPLPSLTPLPILPPGSSATPTPAPTPSRGPVVTPSPRSDEPDPTPSLRPGTSDSPVGPTDPPGSAQPFTDPPGGGDGGVTGGQPALEIGPLAEGDGGQIRVHTGSLGWLGDPVVWLVPGALFAGPGLLILLWVALQATGALAWLPAVRRLRRGGEFVSGPRPGARPAAAGQL